jgi:hypothetical protein
MSNFEVIRFQSDEIQAIREGEQVWVSVKRVCENLGVAFSSQLQKLRKKRWAVVSMINTTGPDGKTYSAACLALDSVPMWLAGIDERKVREDLRDKLVAYQRECAKVLAEYFGMKRHQSASDQALASIHAEMSLLRDSQVAVWQAVLTCRQMIAELGVGGCISAGRYDQLKKDIKHLADVEVATGKWASETKDPGKAAVSDIYREMRDAAEWGSKGKPWRELPTAQEPVVRSVLNRRMKDATKKKPTPPAGGSANGRQLSLVKVG